jgi:hypothetical protein
MIPHLFSAFLFYHPCILIPHLLMNYDGYEKTTFVADGTASFKSGDKGGLFGPEI